MNSFRLSLAVLLLPIILVGARSLPDSADEVSIVVTVLDKKGWPVSDLTKEEFVLVENKEPQELTSLSPTLQTPLTVALLLDISGSRRDHMPGAETEAAIGFFRQVLSKDDLGMLVAFHEGPELVADLTSDAARLETALLRLRTIRPRGSTGALRAMDAVIESRLKNPQGLKSIVIVSDCLDNVETTTLQRVVDQLQRNNISAYVIRLAAPGVLRGRDRRAGITFANKLTEETGGFSVEVSAKNQFEEAFGLIAQTLKGRYVLSYSPKNAKRDGSFRRITIETTRKGTKVLTRKGYYAPKG